MEHLLLQNLVGSVLAGEHIYGDQDSRWLGLKPSHVFAATGRPKRELMGTLRVSFCPDSTREEAKALTEALTEIKNTRIAAG